MFEFTGVGKRQATDTDWRNLQRVDLALLDEPQLYQVFDSGLVQAVNTALGLGMPLLLTGEPGVGKSNLASRIAYELNCGMPLVFRVKSSTEGSELLYRIDHMRRMADAYRQKDVDNILPYLQFGALGMAVLRSRPDLPTELYQKAWPDSLKTSGDSTWGSARSSVVLVDEIDKAPADVPNDLLEELRTLSFDIPEWQGETIRVYADSNDAAEALRYRPVVVITSNSERVLPEAFMRRCVYYHMRFPEKPDEHTLREYGGDNTSLDGADDNTRSYLQLTDALNQRIEALFPAVSQSADQQRNLNAAWDSFWSLRQQHVMQRLPSTGELLNWLSAVACADTRLLKPGSAAWCRLACQLLVKQRDDQQAAIAVLTQNSAPESA